MPARLTACTLVALLVTPVPALAQTLAPDRPAGTIPPDQNLPPYIKKLTGFGERAEFSLDGKTLLFLTKTFGDVMEYDIATGNIRNLTAHFPHYGFTRALYLSNGQILLAGPTEYDLKAPGKARANTWLFILDPSGGKRPQPLNMQSAEGPVPSRTRLHLAWSWRAEAHPDMPPGSSRMFEADIVYDNGVPRLANQKLILDSTTLPWKAELEPQNFVPGNENQLTFSMYNYNQTDAFGIDLTTKKLINYSNAPIVYDEPEGVFPDGKFTTVESDHHNPAGKGFDRADIYKLALDGSGTVTRLTCFAEVPTYRASNPVVSDDGRFMAFQMGRTGVAAGTGWGIFLYDLKAAGTAPKC